MKLTKTHFILGAIAIVTTTGALLLYNQYKKLMNYCISVKSFKLKTLSLTNISFDIFLNFKNNSNIEFTINHQAYDVYLNGVFVTKIKDLVPTLIKANNTSSIAVNIQFSPKDVINILGKNALDLATNLDKIKISIDMSLSVSLYGIPVSIPYVYESTLKELTTPSPVNNSTQNQKC